MKKKNKYCEIRKFYIFDKWYFFSVNVGSWWWYVEKYIMRIFVKVVLLVFGILGFSLVVDIVVVVKLLVVGGVLVVFVMVFWMVWVLLFFMGFCFDFIVVVFKVCDN